MFELYFVDVWSFVTSLNVANAEVLCCEEVNASSAAHYSQSVKQFSLFHIPEALIQNLLTTL